VLHVEGEEVFGSQKCKSTCHLETNINYIGQIESFLFFQELKQGPLELELLVVL
jgi:hypothetical protein